MNRLKCKVCETEFEPLKENKYVVKERNPITSQDVYWDVFDCPKCGCQVLGYRRMRTVGDDA